MHIIRKVKDGNIPDRGGTEFPGNIQQGRTLFAYTEMLQRTFRLHQGWGLTSYDGSQGNLVMNTQISYQVSLSYQKKAVLSQT